MLVIECSIWSAALCALGWIRVVISSTPMSLACSGSNQQHDRAENKGRHRDRESTEEKLLTQAVGYKWLPRVYDPWINHKGWRGVSQAMEGPLGQQCWQREIVVSLFTLRSIPYSSLLCDCEADVYGPHPLDSLALCLPEVWPMVNTSRRCKDRWRERPGYLFSV